jgi:hypothetical protein
MNRSSDRENAVMSDGIAEADLVQIEEQAAQAFAVAPTPWLALLETRHGIAGESFIRLGDDQGVDHELYIRLYKGAEEITSPDLRLDAVVDFIAHATNVIPRLIAEIRRLHSLQT